jgi:uncharacterized protein
MKFIDVADLGNSPKHFDVRIGAEQIELQADNVKLTDGVRFETDAVSNGSDVRLKGRISYQAEIDCIRCLDPVARTAQVDFDINYLPPEHFATDKEHEVQGDALAADLLVADQIDIAGVIREQILLDLPEQIYCREDCKGLCPKCGADRNLIDCDCDETEIDPRWAALKNLK